MKLYSPCILLISDQIEFILQFQAALIGTDFQILSCSTGEQALDKVGKCHIDIVCCADFLAGMEAILICQRFRELTYYLHKPFLLFSSAKQGIEKSLAYQVGVTEVFTYDQFDELICFINRLPCLGRKLAGKVLYIDADEQQRAKILSLLVLFGLTVDQRMTTNTQPFDFSCQSYDLIISSLDTVSDRNGINLATQIRRQSGNKGYTPILLLSNFADNHRRLELFSLGVDANLVAPFTDIELYVCLSGLLWQKKQREIDIQSRSKYQLIYENAAIGIAQVSLEGKFLEVNHYWCKLLGYSESELLQLDFQTITHPDDLHGDLYHVNQLLIGNEQTYTIEKRYRHKDSSHIIWVSLSVGLLRNENNQPLYFISAVLDITEQKNLYKQITAANLKYTNMIDLSYDGFLIVDGMGRIADVNQSYLQLTGYTREEMLQKHINEVEAIESLEQTVAHIKKIKSQGRDLFETKHYTKSGDVIDLEINVTYQAGSDIILSFCRDIGARKKLILGEKKARAQAEQALQRALTAERHLLRTHEDTYRRIGQELHDDLGQKLTAVSIMSGIVSKDVEASAPSLYPYVKQMHERLQQCLNTVRRVSHGLCPNVGDSDFPVMLAILVRDIELIHEITCQVDVDTHWADLVVYYADTIERADLAIQLFRITQEATTNAIKHSGATTITIVLGMQKTGEYVLEISDNGVGFSPTHKSDQSLGIYSMMFRANLINASLALDHNVTGGITVRVLMHKISLADPS